MDMLQTNPTSVTLRGGGGGGGGGTKAAGRDKKRTGS